MGDNWLDVYNGLIQGYQSRTNEKFEENVPFQPPKNVQEAKENISYLRSCFYDLHTDVDCFLSRGMGELE